MSVVTNAILHWPLGRTDDLEKINTFFGESTGFISVNDESVPKSWYGGSKCLECNLAIGAFNYLDLDGLIAHIRAVCKPARSPYQLMIMGQEDAGFRIIDIVP